MKILDKHEVTTNTGKRIPLILVEGITSIPTETCRLILKGFDIEFFEEKYGFEKPRECFSKPTNLWVWLSSYNIKDLENITEVCFIDKSGKEITSI